MIEECFLRVRLLQSCRLFVQSNCLQCCIET